MSDERSEKAKARWGRLVAPVEVLGLFPVAVPDKDNVGIAICTEKSEYGAKFTLFQMSRDDAEIFSAQIKRIANGIEERQPLEGILKALGIQLSWD